MARSGLIIFCATITLALFAGPRSGEAAQAEGEKPAVEEAVQCHKKLGVNGRPHRISAVASLTAVRAWVQQAKKHGAEYTFWNEAESHSIKCEKLDRSDYFRCFASGKPCRADNPDASDSKKAG